MPSESVQDTELLDHLQELSQGPKHRSMPHPFSVGFWRRMDPTSRPPADVEFSREPVKDRVQVPVTMIPRNEKTLDSQSLPSRCWLDLTESNGFFCVCNKSMVHVPSFVPYEVM